MLHESLNDRSADSQTWGPAMPPCRHTVPAYCWMPQQLYYLCTHSKSLKLNVSIVTAFTHPARQRQPAEVKIGTDSEATTMMPPTFPVGVGVGVVG